MNLLFIGRFYPKGIIETIVNDTNGKVGFSNHNFELSLIEGFSNLENVNLRVLSAPMTFSFPHNNKHAFIHKTKYKEGNYNVRSIGFCNVAFLNVLSTINSLKRAILSEINSFDEEEVSVVVNTPSFEISTALFGVIEKIKNKHIRTILIVPDIPECIVEMGGKMTLKNRLLRLMNKRTAKFSLRYDKYVYLTEAMNDFYKVNGNDYIVMEGLIDESKTSHISEAKIDQQSSKEIILYTGTLRRIFGVTFLVDVFEKGKFDNAELWICGSGEAADEISERAKYNKNIKFFGLVDSAKARQLQSQATILANPRSSEGRYTRYSFPSKTMEYLLAGKTVIMNRLPGIPTEYDNYLNYPDDESVDAWVNKLNEIFALNKSYRKNKDNEGRNFILNNKTSTKQCARIVELAQN